MSRIANAAAIQALPAALFSEPITRHDHRYRFYEFPEKQTYWSADKKLSVALRRVVIWNLNSDRRPVCVSNDRCEDALFLGQAMLGRWGKSENSFKYISEMQTVAAKLQATPPRTTLAEATAGRETFKVIDREGKNLFDLVQAMVWNARRTLIDMLKKHYHDERDVVNLLDHISRCHGWIKTTAVAVLVHWEALDLPRYRAAQKEFCDSLNHLQTHLPNGKLLQFSVGRKPL